MTSWPPAQPAAPYPPPSARSTSRSPSRGSRPPYPDPAYPDPYRAEWDAYDRDRAWAAYERDRVAYDYGRRGRSRSPPPGDEGGRKRRRSSSPYDRGRYEPRPRYGEEFDHARSYGPTSPTGRRGYSHHSGRRPPLDPHSVDYAVNLRQYAEWFRYHYPKEAADEDAADKAAEAEAGDGSRPRNGIRARWEKYKKDFVISQLQVMFDHHRKSPWFAEKYDPAPELANLRARVRKEGLRGRLEAFLVDLETGKFDPDVHDAQPEAASSPPKEEVKDENEQPEVEHAEQPAGESAAEGPDSAQDAKPGDDSMQFNMDAGDEGQEGGDAEPNRAEANGHQSNQGRAPRGEEVTVDPEGNQVMIRTIPPDIGRVKLEQACGNVPGFVYLALGDPMQKRNFYRAGWLKFSDDVDMPAVIAELSEKKIEGFKLHVAHNNRPFTGRVRFAPEVASMPNRLRKDLDNAKRLASILEEEAANLRKFKPAKQPVKPAASAADGEESKTAEGKSEEDGNGIPAEAETEKVVEEETIDDEEPEPAEKGSDALERRVEKVVAELVEQNIIDASDEKALESKRNVIALDFYLAYLRSAFHMCYYCAVKTDHLEELQRKCLKHVRKPLSTKYLLDEVKAAEEREKAKEEGVKPESTTDGADKNGKEAEDVEMKDVTTKEKPADSKDFKRNDERWLDWLDSKIALFLDRDGVDPREYGGKSYEEELAKAVEPIVKQEDEGKFRCKTCQKLFKASAFVEKHIANKHPEHISGLDELPYFNNFALDPHGIRPLGHAPPPTGNVQAPPQAYGLREAPPPPVEYGRPPYYAGGAYAPGGFPPAYNGYWDPYAYPPYNAYPPPPPPPAHGGRRLSDRIGPYDASMDYAPPPAGLPVKPQATLEPGPGGRRPRNGVPQGPPPPPPPDAKEDPRAAAGRKVSYHDMDLVAEGDVELTY